MFLQSAQETKTPFACFSNVKVKCLNPFKNPHKQFVCQLGMNIFSFPFLSLNLFLIYWGDDSEDNNSNNKVAMEASLSWIVCGIHSVWFLLAVERSSQSASNSKLFHIVLNDLHNT